MDTRDDDSESLDLDTLERDHVCVAEHTLASADVRLWRRTSDNFEVLSIRVRSMDNIEEYVALHTSFVKKRVTKNRRFAFIYDIRGLQAPRNPATFLARASAFISMHKGLGDDYVRSLSATTIVLDAHHATIVRGIFRLLGSMPQRPVHLRGTASV